MLGCFVRVIYRMRAEAGGGLKVIFPIQGRRQGAAVKIRFAVPFLMLQQTFDASKSLVQMRPIHKPFTFNLDSLPVLAPVVGAPDIDTLLPFRHFFHPLDHYH